MSAAINVTTGKGRNRRQHDVSRFTKIQMNCMTEKTQEDFFGEVVFKRYDRSMSGRMVA